LNPLGKVDPIRRLSVDVEEKEACLTVFLEP
jgi:hypothetical protein